MCEKNFVFVGFAGCLCFGFCSGFCLCFFLCLIGVKVFSWSFPCILWVISWVFVNVVNYTYLYLVWVPMRVSATSLFCCFFYFFVTLMRNFFNFLFSYGNFSLQ